MLAGLLPQRKPSVGPGVRLKASGLGRGSFVPEGQLAIARRFNAGEARTETLVPKGRLRTLVALSRPFGTDLSFGSLTRR
jgi:hypothetical protein